MSKRIKLTNAKRLVIKIGSSLLTAQGQGLDGKAIADWVRQIAALRKAGVQVLLVSSGAVAEGMKRMGWSKRPQALYELQAAAAIGQMGLIQTYESFFKEHGIHTAQVLLTHDDLSNRKRYLNARSTLKTLLDLKVVPVINENDTVTTDEFRFGDNDSLAALVVNLVEAEALILLTDQQGVFDKDPRTHQDAKLIDEANASDSSLDAMVTAKAGALGSGGMFTKVRAARLAARSGAVTAIADGSEENIIQRLREGEQIALWPESNGWPVICRWSASWCWMMVQSRYCASPVAVYCP